MNVWIDIYHIPQFNYYLPLMRSLVALGHSVYLTVLNRGRLLTICRNDLIKLNLVKLSAKQEAYVELFPVGRHRMNKLSAIIEANLLRIIQLFIWKYTHKVDVCFTNGFHSAMIAHIYGIPAYTFGDDPETADLTPKLWFSNRTHFCIVERPKGLTEKAIVLPCLKEWAYLDLHTFIPNPKILDKYDVQPKQYIFLREVSVGTVNYAGQAVGAIRDVASVIANAQCTMHNGEKMKVLFSLEEKNRRAEYPADWILLQEPIEDIHSLIYYSAGLVSSGDSMAREAALLGVPAYYLGIRHSMPANLAASKVANLQNTVTMPFEQWIDSVCDSQKSVEERVNEQNILRDKIDHEFIDINAYMLSLVK